MKVYSAGGAASILGVNRDQIQYARKNGVPKSMENVAGRYQYTEEAIGELFAYFTQKGVDVKKPEFVNAVTPQPAST